jgi:hypothetical protein
VVQVLDFFGVLGTAVPDAEVRRVSDREAGFLDEVSIEIREGAIDGAGGFASLPEAFGGA